MLILIVVFVVISVPAIGVTPGAVGRHIADPLFPVFLGHLALIVATVASVRGIVVARVAG